MQRPAFWGLINPEWSLCNKGRRQSPVNLEPSKLLFDPNLRLLHIDKHRLGGTITNTGHSVIFTVDNSTRHHINVTGGPLSYKYQFQEIHVHYGMHDEGGSEHSINGYAFPAEKSTGRLSTSPGDVESVRQLYQRNPQKSTHRASRELSMSQPTVWRVLCKRLRFRPYSLQLLQALGPADYINRAEFCIDFQNKLEHDNDNFPARLVFSDECTFHLKG
ncbi:hypothetical protein C0J52_18749 [Blattella germanica]|nr:hypothetical protein C0J52_18749 [Blattella germanica]